MARSVFTAFVVGFLCLIAGSAFAEKASMTTSDFTFQSDGKTLSGVIDQPASGPAKALVIFVHGYGPTDIRRFNTFYDLRSRFAELGIASAVWDKPGQGRSEGVFDVNQPVAESAQEVLDAAAALKAQNIPGSDKLGLWGISRAGWIVPIAMAQSDDFSFWISVSGVNDQENFLYLLEQNLPLEGRSAEETRLLTSEWKRGFEILSTGGSFEDYVAATENLRRDPFMIAMGGGGEPSRAYFLTEQQRFLSGEYTVHPESGLMIYVRDFPQMLSGLNARVLALFGEKDTNVDWRKTRALYEKTIGTNPHAHLTLKTFPDGNHILQQALTGGVTEMNTMQERTMSEGYYEAQLQWLRSHLFAPD